MVLRALAEEFWRATARLFRQAADHPKVVGTLLLFLLALGYTYKNAFEWVVNSWMVDREYSHGFLILPLSLFLVYLHRAPLQNARVAPQRSAGALALLFSGFLFLAGRVSGFTLAEALSFLFLLPGLVLYLFGWAHLRVLAFPLFYLQFGVPWADELLRLIQPHFQSFSAAVGGGLLRLAGFSLFRDDKMIYLPNITMEVARECSGVNFLITILALGLPLVYLTQRSWWRALGVVGMAVGITILTNGARVAAAGVMGNTYGPEMLHGPAHIFHGWLVAQVGVVFLFLLNWAVAKLPARGESERLCDRLEAGNEEASGRTKPARARVPAWSALALVLAFGVYGNEFALPVSVPLTRSLDGFPKELGRWRYVDATWLDGKTFFPGTAAELSRVYRDPSGREVDLYIGYYASQDRDQKLVNFRANPLRERGQISVLDPTGPGPRQVLRSRPVLNGAPFVLACWYRLPSGEISSRIHAKIRAITDGLFRRRNNGAVIIVGADLRGGETLAEKDVEEFARLVGPPSREFLP